MPPAMCFLLMDWRISPADLQTQTCLAMDGQTQFQLARSCSLGPAYCVAAALRPEAYRYPIGRKRQCLIAAVVWLT